MMKRFLRVLLVVVVVISAAGMTFLLYGQGAIKKMAVSEVDLTRVNDGIYTGTFSGARWSNAVEVTVRDNKIAEIRVIKDQVIKVPDITKTIIEKIIATQSVKVDSVSGASVTTKAYLKAVENALAQGSR